jgi:hypothetical protein
MEPTLKSISPEMITMVIPNAIIPLNEMFLRIFSIFEGVKKLGVPIEKNTTSITNIISSIQSSILNFFRFTGIIDMMHYPPSYTTHIFSQCLARISHSFAI